MKRCPTCSRVYDDVSMRFCLDDGTTLVNKVDATAAPPTLVMPFHDQAPTIKQDFRPEVAPVQQPTAATVVQKRSVRPWLLGLVVLFLFGAGVVFGVLVIYKKRALSWHLLMEIAPNTPNREYATKETIEVIEKRLSAYGVSDFQVVSQGNGRILVSLPGGVTNPQRLKELLIARGKLELSAIISPPSPAPVQTYATKEEGLASLHGPQPLSRRILPYIERDEPSSSPGSTKWVVVEAPPIVPGIWVKDAAAAQSAGGDYQIDFSLNQLGANQLGAWTRANINQYLGVVLNDEVKSIAYIKSQITDRGQITGQFTKESAENLALVLKSGSGALPAPVTFIEERIDK